MMNITSHPSSRGYPFARVPQVIGKDCSRTCNLPLKRSPSALRLRVSAQGVTASIDAAWVFNLGILFVGVFSVSFSLTRLNARIADLEKDRENQFARLRAERDQRVSNLSELRSHHQRSERLVTDIDRLKRQLKYIFPDFNWD